jgi:Zn-dependent protease with chaperone function
MTMYWALLIALSLGTFVVVHTIAALIIACLLRSLSVEDLPAERSATALFCLRCLPLLSAILAVALFAVPAFLRHEPMRTEEHFSAQTLGLAALFMLMAGLVLLRAIRLLWHTRSIVRSWEETAVRISSALEIPVLHYEQTRPQMAVVGLLRPRLFVSSGAFALLSAEELRAALAHEAAHCRSRDLWRQFIVRLLPDVLPGTRFFAACERRFLKSVEESADESGARASGNALGLASAIVKIAKFADAHPAPLGAYLVSAETELSGRVKRLLKPEGAKGQRLPRFAITATITATALLLSQHYDGLLYQAHHALELLAK